MGWLTLAGVSVFLAVAGVLVWRRPVLALYAFVVGLIVHNTVFLLLFAGGATGWKLTVAQAWKEVLLAVAVARIIRDALVRRALVFRPAWPDAAAVAFGLFVLAYALLPQHLLSGEARPKAVLYGARHYLLPIAAYLAGRSVPLGRSDVRRLAILILYAAALSAVLGIVEEYAVSVAQWHSLGADRYFTDQLGFPQQHGPGGLPENFVFNSDAGLHRRVVSFFLSPLRSAYFFVVALLLAAAGFLATVGRRIVVLASTLVFAGLLFAFTRSALAALALGLALLAPAVGRRVPLALAAGAIVAAGAFAAVFTNVAPSTHFLAADLAYQQRHARVHGGLPPGNALKTTVNLSDPSVESHLTELRAGARDLLEHPLGHGVGNSGQTAARFGVPSRAGESFYLELGADVGVAGLSLWIAFTALTLGTLFLGARRQADYLTRRFAGGVFAAGIAIAALAVMSDVWGVPWLTYVLWWLTGSALTMVLAGPRLDRSPSEAGMGETRVLSSRPC